MEQNFNRSNIRSYFVGKGSKIPLILLIAGICTAAFGIGIVLIIAAVVLWIVKKFLSDFTYEEDVDKATEYEIKQAPNRAIEKLGIVKEQVSLIDPIITSGCAPKVVTATDQIQQEQASKGIIGRLLSRKKTKKSLLNNQDDPKYYLKVGSDDNLRYTLVHNTVFYFGENQLYIYWEYVDIATGIVYSSGTHEYFYGDIVEISTSQERQKQFAPKKKEYIRYINEYVGVNLCSGLSYEAGFRAYTEGSTNNKEIANQIAALRNLVREKKLA